MNLENYIESQYRELVSKDLINPEFLELYEVIEYKKLREILASLHKQLLDLFKMMNERLPTKDNEAHFWAHPSRELVFAIEMTMGLYRALRKSKYAFEIDDYYMELLGNCELFLEKSGGSCIPRNMDKITLYYTEPIFSSVLTQKIVRGSMTFHQELKMIGEGSYAQVFKFKDTYYNKHFVLKRARSDLSNKELERFRREFDTMKSLSSPYIVEVYNYNDSKNEYVMEYIDFTLNKYIEKFNAKLKQVERKNLCLQVLKAFSYLSSKGLLHRDISPNNVLLKKYDDALVVKISDFGLVKVPESTLTSMNTEFKGCFNDPVLVTEGFDNYNVQHEVYALTKLLFFILTGKTNMSKGMDVGLSTFINNGLNSDKRKRYRSMGELTIAFKTLIK